MPSHTFAKGDVCSEFREGIEPFLWLRSLRCTVNLPVLALNIMNGIFLIISGGKHSVWNRALSKLTRPVPFILMYPEGFKFILYGWSQVRPALRDFWREIMREDVYHMDWLKDRDVVVDAGANIGAYAVAASRRVGPNGTVIALEPEPQNFKSLYQNVKLNKAKNVFCLRLALGKKSTGGRLFLSKTDAGSHSVSSNLALSNSFIQINIKPLDEVMGTKKLRKIDLLKIDTEGSELAILQGIGDLLVERVVVASYHYSSQASELTNFLEGRGYQVGRRILDGKTFLEAKLSVKNGC